MNVFRKFLVYSDEWPHDIPVPDSIKAEKLKTTDFEMADHMMKMNHEFMAVMKLRGLNTMTVADTSAVISGEGVVGETKVKKDLESVSKFNSITGLKVHDIYYSSARRITNANSTDSEMYKLASISFKYGVVTKTALVKNLENIKDLAENSNTEIRVAKFVSYSGKLNLFESV